MQSRSMWRFTLTAPTPQRSRRWRPRPPDSQRGFANAMGLPPILRSSSASSCRDELSLKVSFASWARRKKSIYSYQLKRGTGAGGRGRARRGVLCVCNAQWKYQRKSSSPPPPPVVLVLEAMSHPIGRPENGEAVIPSSGRAGAGEGSASNRSARFHSIPLWWRRRGPLNEYAESAFGSDQPAFLSGHEMTKCLPNDQNVIGVWGYLLNSSIRIVCSVFWPI